MVPQVSTLMLNDAKILKCNKIHILIKKRGMHEGVGFVCTNREKVRKQGIPEIMQFLNYI